MSSIARSLASALAVLAAFAFVTTSARADADGARTYLQEARDLIKNNDYDKATAKLELAEAELEGAPEADKAPIAASIKQAVASIAEARAAADKPRLLRKLNNLLGEVENAIGNFATWPGYQEQLDQLLADPGAKTAIPQEMAAAQKKYVTFKKLHSRKALVEISGQVERAVQSAETRWAEAKPQFSDPDASPNSKAAAVDHSERDIANARQQIAQLPAEEELAKKLTARVDVVAAEFAAIALADQAKEVAEQMKRSLESYADEFPDWEKEATTPGPTWEAYTKRTSAEMSAFLAPHTRAFRERAEIFLKNLAENSDYQVVAASRQVKAYVDDVRAKLDRATATLLKRIRPVVASADSAAVKDTSDFERLRSDVRLTLGDHSAEAQTLMAKLQAKLDAHEAATTGAEAAGAKLVETLRAKADEVWPGLYKGMDYVTDIDLSSAGQQIGFLADNLMGYRFKAGDYYFATTLSGHPVAAKIDPQIMAGIRAIEQKIGRALGDDDGDGKWDIIAVVTKKKAQLMARRQTEATGKIGGADVKLSGEYAEPVQAVIIEIIAAKCGPFAGAKDRGVLRPDGTVGK